ncbi:MAG: hypothetical protein BWX88_03826 [Planctomycetes bacterium ADurb.Bin126]|nr:MAG: hypothetical protein BWX88_03826 [Planctomycetes bacterium ADurb.Bin126]HQL74349.1 hypothetical protein [Phycisphaerae bacterium]
MPRQQYDSVRRNKALARKRKQEQKRLTKQARKAGNGALPVAASLDAGRGTIMNG